MDPSFPRRRARYARGAIGLHWLIAFLFALQIGLGWRTGGPPGPQTFAVFQLHKSIGITILLLTLARLYWRLRHTPPPYPREMPPWQRAAAHWTHILFYLLLIGLPLSGWLIVSSSRTGIPTILYGIVPWPHLPGIPHLAVPLRAEVNSAAGGAHASLVYLAYVLILLHLLGALKHQWVDGDGELGRMIPLPRFLLSAGLALALTLFVGAALLGRLTTLRPVAVAQAARIQAPPPQTDMPSPAAGPEVLRDHAPAPAAPPPPRPAIPVTQTQPTAWIARKSATLRFHTAWSQGGVDGYFERWTSTILFDPAALGRSSVSVSIDMASARTGVSDTESALPQGDWFATALHPTASYQAKRFVRLGPDRYRASGTLTLRGITHPVPLDFSLVIRGDVATMTGTARVDRTQFGVGQAEWADTSDLPAAVAIAVAITADRKSPSSKGDRK